MIVPFARGHAWWNIWLCPQRGSAGLREAWILWERSFQRLWRRDNPSPLLFPKNQWLGNAYPASITTAARCLTDFTLNTCSKIQKNHTRCSNQLHGPHEHSFLPRTVLALLRTVRAVLILIFLFGFFLKRRIRSWCPLWDPGRRMHHVWDQKWPGRHLLEDNHLIWHA